MPQTMRVTAPNGQTLTIQGDRVPSESELQMIFKQAGVDTVEPGVSQPPASMLGTIGQTIGDAAKGVEAGAMSTVFHGGDLIRRGLGMERVIDRPAVQAGITPPDTTAGKVGYGGERVAEFFAPTSALAKAKTALATGSGILDALVGAGLEGASAGAVNTTQTGTTEGAGKTAAIGAGAAVGSQAVLAGAQGAAGWLGQRIERALLKPSVATLEGQSEKELVKKVYQYNVGGTLGQTYDKVQAKLADLSAQLRNVLKLSSALGGGVSLNQIAKDVEADYLHNPQARAAVSRILDHVEFGLNRQGISAGTGVLDVADGNVAKQAVGDMGAWLHDMRGNTVSDADKVTEDVANRFYTKLKTAIEQNSKGPVAAINKQISDLLPIRQAVIRRIPVADRANVLSMADLIGFSTHTFGLSLANRVLNSGRAANALVKAGEANAAPLANTITRGIAGSQAGQ